MSGKARVAIILLNYNGLVDTLACLQSLRSVPGNGTVYDVYVVDNGSSGDDVARIADAHSEARVIPVGENLGFAGGNNVALNAVRVAGGYEYALLLNNDTVVEPDFLQRLLETMDADPGIGVISPIIYYFDVEADPNSPVDNGLGPRAIWYNGGRVNEWTAVTVHDTAWNYPDMVFDTGYVCGCCMLIRRKVLEDVGSLQEVYFIYLEDLDFSASARKKGWRLCVDQRSRIYHKVSMTMERAKDRTLYLYQRNRIIYMRRHNPWRLPLFLPYHIVRRILPHAVLSLPNLGRAWLNFKALWDGVTIRV